MVVNVAPSKFDICLISGFIFNVACVTANYWPPPPTAGSLIQGDILRVAGSYPPSGYNYPPHYQTSHYDRRIDSYPPSRYGPSSTPAYPGPQGYGYSYGPPPHYYGYNRYASSTSSPYYRLPPPSYGSGGHIPYQFWRTPSTDQFDRRGGHDYTPYPPVSNHLSQSPPYGLPPPPPPFIGPPRVAYAKLKSKSSKVEGEVRFVQHDRYVGITGRISGLTEGAHGFHVHEGMEKEGGSCDAIGDHFNPQRVDHGGKSEWIRHVGDLGNIFADYHGVAYFSFTDNLVSLFGPHSILNRTIAVTELGDDLGRGPKMSKINGNAGKAVACGVIGLINSSYA